MKKNERQILFSYIQAHGGAALYIAGAAAVFAAVFVLSGLPAMPVLYAAVLCAAGGVFLRAVQYAARTDVIRPRQPPGAAAVRLSLRLCRSLSGAAQNT